MELRMKMMMMMMIFIKVEGSEQITSIDQTDSVISVDVGANVTLHCFRLREENTHSFIWYKQKVGYKPRVMAAVQSEPNYEDEFKSPRFSIEKDERSCSLKITNVEPSDEATYYCGVMRFLTIFRNVTFLAVKGKPDLKVSVLQSDIQDAVPPGASVTLQCSVLSESRTAELRVFWFRAAPSQSRPQIIYTHHDSSRQCERVTSIHTCVYNFSKNILSLNDTGTYYCAVALCGKIVLGNGTLVQIERFMDPAVTFLAAALGVCVVVIFALISAIMYKRSKYRQHKVKHAYVMEKTLNRDCETKELNYAALHFGEMRGTRGRVKKQQSQDIIYSDVQCSSVT